MNSMQKLLLKNLKLCLVLQKFEGICKGKKMQRKIERNKR